MGIIMADDNRAGMQFDPCLEKTAVMSTLAGEEGMVPFKRVGPPFRLRINTPMVASAAARVRWIIWRSNLIRSVILSTMFDESRLDRYRDLKKLAKSITPEFEAAIGSLPRSSLQRAIIFDMFNRCHCIVWDIVVDLEKVV